MNNLKKAMLLGLLIPSAISINAAAPAPTSTINQVGRTLTEVGTFWDASKDIFGGAGWVNDAEKYAITPARELGKLLVDLESMQDEVSKAVAKLKQLPTVAKCVRQSDAVLKKVEACTKIGCASRKACMAVGIDNLITMLQTLEKTLFGSKGVVTRGLNIIMQPQINAELKSKVADPIQKVIAMLTKLKAILATSAPAA